MKILVVGGSGLLGSQIARQAVAAGDQVAITYLHRRPTDGDPPTGALHRLDLRDPVDIRGVVDAVRPELIINAGYAYQDWRATAVGPADLALAVRDRSIRLVQVSSDAVFSGRDVRYDEMATPDPINPYGAAKAAAEVAVAAILPSAAIARTSLIIGHGRSNHEHFVQRWPVAGRGCSSPTTSAARLTSMILLLPCSSSGVPADPGSTTSPVSTRSVGTRWAP